MSGEDPSDPEVRVVDRRWWARGDNAAEPADAPARKPTQVEDLENRLAEANRRLQEYAAEHRRSLDEFEQVKARIRREVAREVERGRRAVVTDLLEVLDNLDRAISAARPAGHDPGAPRDDAVEKVARGVELVRDQFRAKLEAFGVAPLEALGEPFDPLRHDAVSIAPVDDPSRDGMVVAVLKEGYVVGDELLRPASVVVGKAS